ncbi:phosphate ABC transporter substrate-binding protein [Natroniella acetigena]|uniref:phosphate ABC transporter substrate-binding protein n=1 Tax=Natroniella acetigena TaxID=52004 RepID=UPI002009F164|nr:phosphate ABC transporter substrate-binding protein [Natroniella acetigena]MCK8828012.1 phosphate ABC transporter substrate-binding protein [Natroniella acetigena]
MSLKRITILTVFLLLFSLTSQVGYAAELRVSGASTIQPILEEVAQLYQKEHGFEIIVQGGGSSLGVDNTTSGESDIGAVSRSLTEEEKEEVEYITIGLDALAVIINSQNGIEEINKQQLIDIYTERITDWAEFGLESRDIVLISKMTGRSTLDLFEGYTDLESPSRKGASASQRISEQAHEIGSNLEMITVVGGIPNSIGYVSLGTASVLQQQGAPIKILPLDGVDYTERNIVRGDYPIIRELNLVYQTKTDEIADFIEFLMSDIGREIIEDEGFIFAEEE